MHSGHDFVELLGTVDESVVQRLANVFCDVTSDVFRTANRPNVENVRVGRNFEPSLGQFSLRKKETLQEAVDVDIPCRGRFTPLDFDKRTAPVNT